MGHFDSSLTPEARAERKAKIERLNADADDNWHDPEWHRAMAAEITTTITWGFEHENLLDLLTQVEEVGPNDRVTVKERRGLRAFWVSRGGYIEASSMRTDSMELHADTIGFHVFEHVDKVRANFGETQQDLIDLGVQRLSGEVNLRVLRLFQARIQPGGDQYITGTGIDLDVIDTALDQVMDETNDDNVTIIGRRTMIGQIEKQMGDGTNYRPETNEAWIQRGVIGNYRGARLVTLKNFKDDEDVAFFPANEAFIIGRDASKFAFWGGPQEKEWEDPNWYWHYQTRRDFGGSVYRPERARRVVDESITP